MKDKYQYFSMREPMDEEKLALCEPVFSNCPFSSCKYSIIIPEYRRPVTVRESILSAVNQDYPGDYEVLVTSDGQFPEEQETERVVREIAETNPRISYYRNRTNVGMFNNWNNSIWHAKGEWIVVLPDDDLLSPYYLSTIDRFISRFGYSGMIGSIPHKIYGKEKYDAESFKKPEGRIGARWIDNYGVFFDDGINVTGMAFEKKTILELGGFHNVFFPVADSVCMINYAVKSNLVRLDCDISAYRIDENVSQNKGILEKILLYAAHMKETVAETSPVLKNFWTIFRAEMVQEYIRNAETSWNTKVEKDSVDEDVRIGFSASQVKYTLMKAMKIGIQLVHKAGLALKHRGERSIPG